MPGEQVSTSTAIVTDQCCGAGTAGSRQANQTPELLNTSPQDRRTPCWLVLVENMSLCYPGALAQDVAGGDGGVDEAHCVTAAGICLAVS